MHSKAAQLRELLKGQDILVLPGVYDAFTAKIAESVGFSVLVMGGYSIAASQLGEPDVGYLSMTEMAQAVKSINDATSLPVFADGDTGYGNAMSVRRTVREYEKAGAAAIIFEDQVWPKRCGHMQGKQVIAKEEHAMKITAAVEARTNPDTVIVARTDARAVYDLEEAIIRGRLYIKAGADALFIEAPQNKQELEIIAREFPDTVLVANMIEGGKTPCIPATDLQRLGYKAVFWPCTSLYTVAAALTRVFTDLKQHGTTAKSQADMLNFDQFNGLIGLDQFQALEEKYKCGGR